MSERYSRLCLLEERLYCSGSPVLIEAGALLRDNSNGHVLAQFKFRNLADESISAMVIRVDAFDSFGQMCEGVSEFHYMDLDVRRNAEFGQKTAVPLPDASTRSVKVKCLRVAYKNGGEWAASEDAFWQSIPKEQQLHMVLPQELIEQYRRETHEGVYLFPILYEDLWRCACGTYNSNAHTTCCGCRCEKKRIFGSLNQNALRAHLQEEQNTQIYAKAALLAEHGTIGDLRTAVEQFASLGDWKDAPRQLEINREKLAIREASAKVRARIGRNITISVAAVVAVIVIAATLLNRVIIPDAQKRDQYAAASALMDAARYEEAIEAFSQIREYEDSAEKMKECTELQLRNARIGDIVSFGRYTQDAQNEQERQSIAWIVLDVKDGKALLISKNALDRVQYHMYPGSITWENSLLRSWLNGDFLDEAFTEAEKTRILTVQVPPDVNPGCNTDPGNATEDRVFVLSIPEAERYFASDEERTCQLAGSWELEGEEWFWWLRTPGMNQQRAAYVWSDGEIRMMGSDVTRRIGFVRPALWVDLNA